MNKIKKFVKKFKKNVDNHEELTLFLEEEGKFFNAYISGDDGIIDTLQVGAEDYNKFLSHLAMNQIDYVVR